MGHRPRDNKSEFDQSLERNYECYCMTGYKLVGGTFRTDLNEPDKQFEVGDGCEDIDECAVAADGSVGAESRSSEQL